MGATSSPPSAAPMTPLNLTLFHHHPHVPCEPPPIRGHGWEGTYRAQRGGGPAGEETLTLRFPSAVIRSRLQVPQKCSDIDVMKLTWPRKPGILKACGRARRRRWGWASSPSLTSDLTPFPLRGSPEESRLQGPQTTETLSSLPTPGLPKMKAPKVSGNWGQHGQRRPRGRARQAPVHHLLWCAPQQAP